MTVKLIIQNRIIIVSFIVVIAIISHSCGKTFYIFGSQSRSGFYTYNGQGSGSFNNQSSVDWKPTPGMQIGLATDIANINKYLSIKTELNTSLQGARYEDVSNRIKGSIDLLYIYVPIEIRFYHKIGIYGEAGLQPGYLISARDRVKWKSSYFNDYITKWDFGMTGGLGYEFKNHIGIGLSVFQGFSNISVAKNDGKSNNIVALRATYRLRMK